jgi:hypothetical protein
MFVFRQRSHDTKWIPLPHTIHQRNIALAQRLLQTAFRTVTPKPNAHLRTLLVDLAHHGDLLGLFLGVVLIDAHYHPASQVSPRLLDILAL